MKEYKIESLPKWAQQKIANLERNVAQLREEKRKTEVGDTDVFITDYVSGDIPLPRGTQIEFRLGERQSIRVRIDEDRSGTFVTAMARQQLVVEPRVTNVVRLRSVTL